MKLGLFWGGIAQGRMQARSIVIGFDVGTEGLVEPLGQAVDLLGRVSIDFE